MLARLLASPRMPAALVLKLDMWVVEVRGLLPQRGRPPPQPELHLHEVCNFISTQCGPLAWWARRAASGQLPGGEQLRAMAADPRRGVAMRLRVLASLLERVRGMEPPGSFNSGINSPCGALAAVQALARAVDGAAQLPGGAEGAAAAGGGPASQQQRPEEREEQREREAQRGHAALVSELLGELLVGQAAPAGHLATGAGAGAVALGQQQQAQPGQQQQRVGPPPAPVKLPGLLQAAGCWHLGCMRVGGSARTQACEGCGLARYCGPGCQRAHWPLHRAQCLRWRGQLGGGPAQQAGATAGAGWGSADEPAGG